MAPRRDTRAFEAAAQALLAPLARYAEANGIGRRRFAQIIAEAARGRLAQVEPALPYDIAVRLVSRWSMDSSYSTRGKPKALPFRGRGSFGSLVREARAGDAGRAREALLAAGLVKEGPRGHLRLLQTAYVPQAGKAENIDILGRAAGDFIRVLAHNVFSPPQERFLQRVASYDNIGASSLMMLRKALRREGLRALERANALLASRDRDRGPRAGSGRRTRVSFGVYLLEEPVGARSRRKR